MRLVIQDHWNISSPLKNTRQGASFKSACSASMMTKFTSAAPHKSYAWRHMPVAPALGGRRGHRDRRTGVCWPDSIAKTDLESSRCSKKPCVSGHKAESNEQKTCDTLLWPQCQVWVHMLECVWMRTREKTTPYTRGVVGLLLPEVAPQSLQLPLCIRKWSSS